MELASLFLLVLLPPADATGDTATAIAASLRHELGDVALAIAPDTMVTPDMWQGDRAPMRARFVVHVAWKESDRASIEVVAPSSMKDAKGFKRTRELAFAPQDSKAERGRAMGLVVAELLRESPPSALVAPAPAVDAVAAESRAPPRVMLGGMFSVERVHAGNWAMGPDLTYAFRLAPAVRLQTSGRALFGSSDQYTGIGAGAGIYWDFLGSELGRHAVGIGLDVGVLHESAAAGDNSQGASMWNLALAAGLAGRLTVWRRLRVIGEIGLRATWGAMRVGDFDDPYQPHYSLSRWRPDFALGLEIAL